MLMPIAALFASHERPLTRRLERMVGCRETAEDLRQEAFARAWHRAPREASPEQQVAWLYRTASNLAIDELRRRRLRDFVALDEAVSAGTDEDPAERIAAREALARLTPHDRLVLLLRFEGGLSHEEIGALLDTSPDAARK